MNPDGANNDSANLVRDSANLVRDSNTGPKRGREGKSDDGDEPLIKKAASSEAVELSIDHVIKTPLLCLSKSARRHRRQKRAKQLKKLANEEDNSGNLVRDNNKGSKREREDTSDDADKPLIKKAASTEVVELSNDHVIKTPLVSMNPDGAKSDNVIGNLVRDNNKHPKREREGKSDDGDEPLINKAASTQVVELSNDHVTKTPLFSMNPDGDKSDNIIANLVRDNNKDPKRKREGKSDDVDEPLTNKAASTQVVELSNDHVTKTPLFSISNAARWKILKQLKAYEEHNSRNLVRDNNKGPKREREGKSNDADEPLMKKTASTEAVELSNDHVTKTPLPYMSKCARRKQAMRLMKLATEEDRRKTASAKAVELSNEHVIKTSDSYLSKTRFDQFPLSPLSLKAIEDVGFKTMTVVQEATLPIILKGKDVLAKAKTGTGKTVAFLLPSIEAVIKSPPISEDNMQPPIIVLVVCPTRELALQAAAEANNLLKYHTSIGVQVVIGGTNIKTEQLNLQTNPCQILMATPGRLDDHIRNTSGFATRLMGVKILVLDEADRLLDMGFRKDIDSIIAAIPKQRQTFLFSATVPEGVHQICHVALKPDHEFVNCIQEGSGETNQKVRQTYMIAELNKHISLLYVLLKKHMAENEDYKVIIFYSTAKVTALVANLLGHLSLNVREIHSRKLQSYRTRVSNEFRNSKGIILVSSDVSARGVDYPDVSLVIQIGLPSNREQYIHRIGRTGRIDKEGEGILLLAPCEEYFISFIKDLPITMSPPPPIDDESVEKVLKGLEKVIPKKKKEAYMAWFGYNIAQRLIVSDNKIRLVELANEFSRSMGLEIPPSIPKRILNKLGLTNVNGIRIGRDKRKRKRH